MDAASVTEGGGRAAPPSVPVPPGGFAQEPAPEHVLAALAADEVAARVDDLTGEQYFVGPRDALRRLYPGFAPDALLRALEASRFVETRTVGQGRAAVRRCYLLDPSQPADRGSSFRPPPVANPYHPSVRPPIALVEPEGGGQRRPHGRLAVCLRPCERSVWSSMCVGVDRQPVGGWDPSLVGAGGTRTRTRLRDAARVSWEELQGALIRFQIEGLIKEVAPSAWRLARNPLDTEVVAIPDRPTFLVPPAIGQRVEAARLLVSRLVAADGYVDRRAFADGIAALAADWVVSTQFVERLAIEAATPGAFSARLFVPHGDRLLPVARNLASVDVLPCPRIGKHPVSLETLSGYERRWRLNELRRHLVRQLYRI